VIAPVFLGIAIASVLGWRAGIWVAVVAFVAVEIWRGRSLSVFGEPGQVLTRKASGALPTLTYWALVANMCYVGAEFCMSLWGVDLLREQVGLSPAAAAAGLGALTGGIFVGRAFGAGITRAVPAERLLIISAVVGIVAFGVMWLATSAPVMLAAFFVTGLGISLQWPLGMARILRSCGGRTDRAAGAALAFGTAAIGAGPFVLGALAERMPIHEAFLIVPVLLCISLGIVIFRPVPEVVAESAVQAGV
jgi:fucose permease